MVGAKSGTGDGIHQIRDGTMKTEVNIVSPFAGHAKEERLVQLKEASNSCEHLIR